MNITRSKKLWLYFSVFIILNILLYLFILLFNSKIPFSKFDYTKNAHHYFTDPRIKGGKFDFLRAMEQYDAQWYLKIADEGYPKNPTTTNMNNKSALDGLTYAFFPLYPLILAFINLPIKNIELAAFITSNVIMVAIFLSLYIIIKNLYDETQAFKTIFLLLFFPFAIFYRSYFTEGLFLLLLIWFSYFLIKKQWLRTAFFLSLLFVTRPNGAFFELLFLYFIINAYRHKQINIRLLIYSLIISLLPFLGWLMFCYINTGSSIYWMTVQSHWEYPRFPISLFWNIFIIFNFFSLPIHSFHASKIDMLTVIFVGILLFFSRKKLRPELWWISFILWVVPLITRDTMSFTRYQIVSFPLFLYLAQKLHGRKYIFLLSLFCLSLFFLSLFFVNWYWIG